MLTVVTTSISQNGAFGASHDGPNGGGIDNRGTLILAKSTISDNTASFGGGALYNAGEATISNSTISGNTAQVLPGHNIVNAPTGIVELSDSTIFANAPENGVRFVNLRTEPAVFLGNTIVANIGGGTNCSGAITSDGYNIDTGTSCQLSQPTDHPSTNAGLAALGNNGGPTPTHALVPGSPAIDAGPPVFTPCSTESGIPCASRGSGGRATL